MSFETDSNIANQFDYVNCFYLESEVYFIEIYHVTVIIHQVILDYIMDLNLNKNYVIIVMLHWIVCILRIILVCVEIGDILGYFILMDLNHHQ